MDRVHLPRRHLSCVLLGAINRSHRVKRSHPLDAAVFLAVVCGHVCGVCGHVCGRRCPEPQASLSDPLGLLLSTLARPRCFGNQSKLCLCEVAIIVIDARIVTVLNMLRELKAVGMTPTVVATSLCKGACRSKIPQDVGVIFNQCGCRLNGVLALE